MRKLHRQPRKTQTQWKQIITDFNQTDLPAKVYCEEHDLAYGTFAKWRQRLARDGRGKPNSSNLIELTTPVSPMPTPEPWQVELELGNGLILRLRTA